MKYLSYFGRVEDKEIVLPRRMRGDMISLFEGKEIEVIIRRRKKRRSTNQNKYYWAVVVELLREHLDKVDPSTSWTPSKVHEIIKFKFLRKQHVNQETAEIEFEYTGSTTSMSTAEFLEFIKQIQRWCAETFDLYIPDPNEQVTFF